jgi:MFS family permease
MDIAPRSELGIRANLPQFTLLVVVNAFVGAMIGLERSILPALAEQNYGILAKTGVLSFIVVFGLVKALTNYFAGSFSDRVGRRRVLITGWLFALPAPFLLMWAPSWDWILVANVFLGISQGLTWSTTVIMKIDLVGPRRRGLAMGLNEFAGYAAVGISALATGYIAEGYGLTPEPFYLGVVYAVVGLLLTVFFVKETIGHVHREAEDHVGPSQPERGRLHHFLNTTFGDRNLSTIVQAGFVNNLNDGMAWGLFPILYASAGLSLERIGWLAAIYPLTWGILQLWTGHLSDSLGRKPMIASGMLLQSVAIGLIGLSDEIWGFAIGSVALGAGTAMVYPTLLAAIGDIAHPMWRATSVGVYRFWRDAGYAVGALAAGIVADSFGIGAAVWSVAAVTFLSGVIVMGRFRESRSLN